MTEPPRVLELGSGFSAAYAGKLLGDHGADVVKVEPPEGDTTRRRGPFPGNRNDPEQSGAFLALNLNKRGVCLDLDTESGRSELRKLIHWADILVHNYSRLPARALGLDPVTLKAERPALVTLSITPFGNTGPYRDFVAEDITVANAGGWANLCPRTHTDPSLPPLKVFGNQAAMMAGIAGATAALATFRDARRSGVGDYIDLSAQAYIASGLEGAIPGYAYQGVIRRRYELNPWGTFDAQDGPILMLCMEESQWERIVEFMGHPEWTELEMFANQRTRHQNYDAIIHFYQEFISSWNAFELFHAGQARRICLAPVMNFEQVASDRHLRARDGFVTVDHPETGPVEYLAPAVLTTSGRAEIRCPAPRLGEHNAEVLSNARPASHSAPESEARLPLDGVRVVDLSWVWAGPFAAMHLAHLGAEVIRCESSTRPDLYRRGGMSNPPDDMEPSLNRAGMFNQWNQGKKSVAVDLSDPRGIEIVKGFVAESDVVVQNFGTGVMARLGLGYEELRRINPRIILASISGYGQVGPYREYLAYGPALVPLTGLASVTGFIGGKPDLFGPSIPDPTAGMTAAWAVVSALDQRERTGVGDHLDLSLWEATGVLAIEAWMQYAFDGTQPERMGNRDPWMAPHGCFACRGDDEWVSIACAGNAQWSELATLIDSALVDDDRFLTLEARKRNEDALEEIVSRWTAGKDRWEVTWLLQAQGVAAFPSFTTEDIVQDPHLNSRGFIERLDHPEVGRRAHVGIPWRHDRRPNGVRAPAPCLGADTDTLLAEVLGYDGARIKELRDGGVLR
ncbi:MAG: CoA transferase [Gammaproteobacteria bacterium]|nr:CoA transferase [Gammaproteobacteria bacterium]